MTATQAKIYTVEEYFELEKNAEEKHEFVNGQVIKMLGTSKKENEIASNFLFLIRQPLRKKGFHVYFLNVRTVVRERQIYRYPDLVVAHKMDNSDAFQVKFPVLLAEVASDDSSKTDRETKLREYTNLDSAQFYVIIDQTQMLVEVYSRQGNRWFYDQFDQPTDAFALPIFDLELSLADIYEGITFDAETKSDAA